MAEAPGRGSCAKRGGEALKLVAALAGTILLCAPPPALSQSSGAPAAPQGEQVGDLYRDCMDAEYVRNSLRQERPPEGEAIGLASALGRCEGYIAGYIDGFAFGNFRGASEYRFCLPDNATMTQVYAVFREYARTHPERHHWPKSWGLNDALYRAFPCPT